MISRRSFGFFFAIVVASVTLVGVVSADLPFDGAWPWPLPAAPETERYRIVHFSNGPVRCRVLAGSGITECLCVEYAARPIGALRFQPAAPAPHHPEVRDALTFGAPPVQLNPQNFNATSEWFTTLPPVSETHPLCLNYWLPAHDLFAGADFVPVFLYAFAGGFINGATYVNNGTQLVLGTGAAFVGIGYRLNVFGNNNVTNSIADIAFAYDFVRLNAAATGISANGLMPIGVSAGCHATAELLRRTRVVPGHPAAYHRVYLFECAEMLLPTQAVQDAAWAAQLAILGYPSEAELLALPFTAFNASFQLSAFSPTVGPNSLIKTQATYGLIHDPWDKSIPVVILDASNPGAAGYVFFLNSQAKQGIRGTRNTTFAQAATLDIYMASFTTTFDVLQQLDDIYLGTDPNAGCAPYADCGDAASDENTYVFTWGSSRILAQQMADQGVSVYLVRSNCVGVNPVDHTLLIPPPGQTAPGVALLQLHAMIMPFLLKDRFATQPVTSASLEPSDLAYSDKLHAILKQHIRTGTLGDLIRPYSSSRPEYLKLQCIPGVSDSVVADPNSAYPAYALTYADLTKA